MNMKSFLNPVIKILLIVHAFLGKVIDVLAIRRNGGIHPKHRLMKYYEFFLENIDPSDAVLDIGCGNGFVASKIAEKARKVTGIDTDKKNIGFAKRAYIRGNTEFIIGDATTYSFHEKYDAIVLSNVLEHIQERVLFLKKVCGLSDKLLIRVPMLDRDWLPLYKKQLGMFYFCDSTHFTEYTLKSFREEMGMADLVVETFEIRFGEIWAVARRKDYVSKD